MATTREDHLEILEDSLFQIREALDGLRLVAREAENGDLLRRGVISHIEMALDDDHEWMGRNMHTLSDFIEGVKEGS